MPRRGQGKYTADRDDNYDYDDDADDGYDKRQHPTSRYVKEQRAESAGTQLTSTALDVPQAQHALIVGKHAATLNDIEARFRVKVLVPPGSARSNTVHVDGTSNDVAAAVAHIKTQVLSPPAAVVAGVAAGSSKRGNRGGRGGAAQVQDDASAPFPTLPGQELRTISIDFEKIAHNQFVGTGGLRVRELERRLSTKEGVPTANKHVGIAVVMPDKSDTTSIISVLVPAALVPHTEKTVRDFLGYYNLLEHLRGVTVSGAVSAVMAQSVPGEAAPPNKGGRRRKAAVKADVQPEGQPETTAAVAVAAEKPAVAAEKPAAAPRAAVQAGHREPRPPCCPFVDLVATSGYTHAVLPQRT
jgi:hypothetical protein